MHRNSKERLMQPQQPQQPPILAEIRLQLIGEETFRVYRQARFAVRPISDNLTHVVVENTTGDKRVHIFCAQDVREIDLLPSALAAV